MMLMFVVVVEKVKNVMMLKGAKNCVIVGSNNFSIEKGEKVYDDFIGLLHPEKWASFLV